MNGTAGGVRAGRGGRQGFASHPVQGWAGQGWALTSSRRVTSFCAHGSAAAGPLSRLLHVPSIVIACDPGPAHQEGDAAAVGRTPATPAGLADENLGEDGDGADEERERELES